VSQSRITNIIKVLVILFLLCGVIIYWNDLLWYRNLFTNNLFTLILAIALSWICIEVVYRFITEIFDALTLLINYNNIKKAANSNVSELLGKEILANESKSVELRSKIKCKEIPQKQAQSYTESFIKNLFKIK
jgi:hypothetical protein